MEICARTMAAESFTGYFMGVLTPLSPLYPAEAFPADPNL